MKNQQKKILDFINNALRSEKPGNKEYLNLGNLTKTEVETLKGICGKDFSGYVHSIDEASIRHAFNRHKELQPSDILLIPFIVNHYDFIGYGNKTNTIVYKKVIGQELFLVEEIRTGRKKFVLKTMYKRRKRSPKE